MRFFVGLVLALALGVMGCSETSDPGGTGGDGGSGGDGGVMVACVDEVCPCSEAGIRAAIAEGGGPFTFDCDGPTTVHAKEIGIGNDVILDGEGDLTVYGSHSGRVFSIGGGNVTLKGIRVRGGYVVGDLGGGGILNGGTLTLENCTVSGNFADVGRFPAEGFPGGAGIYNFGDLTVVNSTVSGNTADRGAGAGIFSLSGEVSIINSTVSGNTVEQGGQGTSIGLFGGEMNIVNGTILGNADEPGSDVAGRIHMTNTLVEGRCDTAIVTSGGYNIESPGDTCGFDQATDQVNVSAPWVGVLGDNGGPTMTHRLLSPSPAIDAIPQAECVDADGAPLTTDQRGFPRDSMCDVGAFEVQP